MARPYTLTECPSCNRTEERTYAGWRLILLNASGICAACQEAKDETEN